MRSFFVVFFLLLLAGTSASRAGSVSSQAILVEKTKLNILLVSMKFINDTGIPYKDMELVCEIFGESGTSLGKKEKTIYKIVPEHSELIVGDINMGFVNSQVDVSKTKCRVEGISR